MINKINFTGRETMLSKGVSAVAKADQYEYVGAGKIYSKEAIKEVMDKIDKARMPKYEQSVYTSPFAPANVKAAASVDFIPETLPHAIDIKA
jgi:hypothetical protein